MPDRIPAAAALALLVTVASAVHAQPADPDHGHGPAAAVEVGAAAPPIQAAAWIRGEPVERFEPGRVYVVHFWSAAHARTHADVERMSTLGRKHADDKIEFVAVHAAGVEAARVESTLKEMGQRISERVALDAGDGRGLTATAYLGDAGQIATAPAIIVGRDGKVAWVGDGEWVGPMLQKIVAGEFDPAAEARAEAQRAAKREVEQAANRERILRRVFEAQQAGQTDQVLALIDELAALDDEFATRAGVIKFGLLLHSDRYDQAFRLADELGDGAYRNDAEALNEISWTILDEEGLERRDYPLALKLAKRAVEITRGQDAAILDTLARAHFDTGEIAKAVMLQREAVKKADDDLRAELEATLERYENATQIR